MFMYANVAPKMLKKSLKAPTTDQWLPPKLKHSFLGTQKPAALRTGRRILQLSEHISITIIRSHNVRPENTLLQGEVKVNCLQWCGCMHVEKRK